MTTKADVAPLMRKAVPDYGLTRSVHCQYNVAEWLSLMALGIAAEVLVSKNLDATKVVGSVLVGVVTMGYVWARFIGIPVLPVKIYYVDFPVVGVAALGERSFVATGGGGGLAYGVEDTTLALRLVDARFESFGGIPINLFAQHNKSQNPMLARDLYALEAVQGATLPMCILWGLSSNPARGLMAGGAGGDLAVVRLSEDTEAVQKLARIQMIALQPGEKARYIVNCTRVSPSGILVAAGAERGGVMLLAVLPPIMEQLGSPSVSLGLDIIRQQLATRTGDISQEVVVLGKDQVQPERGEPIAVDFTPDEKHMVVLTSMGFLLWYPAASIIQDVNISFLQPMQEFWGCPKGIAANGQPWGEPQAIRVPIDDSFITKYIRILPKSPKPDAYTIIGIGCYRVGASHQMKYTWGLSRMIIACSSGKLVSQGHVQTKQIPMSEGCGIAVNTAGNLLAVIGNDRFLISSTSNLTPRFMVARNDLGSKADTLPSTSVTFTKDDRFLVVGCGDFSVCVAELPQTHLKRSIREKVEGAYESWVTEPTNKSAAIAIRCIRYVLGVAFFATLCRVTFLPWRYPALFGPA